MKNEIFDLAKKMLDFSGLPDRGYSISAHPQNEQILFVSLKEEKKYELWETSSIWSVSTMDRDLLKKHEDFYFAFKFLLIKLLDEGMDQEFNQSEETF